MQAVESGVLLLPGIWCPEGAIRQSVLTWVPRLDILVLQCIETKALKFISAKQVRSYGGKKLYTVGSLAAAMKHPGKESLGEGVI